MITESDLARYCPARTFQRARQIAENGKNILTRQCRYGEYDTTLSAFVAASSGWADRYRTSVTLDEDEGRVIDYSCTCPAFLKYDGMCKHTVALSLTYLDDPQSFMGYKPTRTPETSPSIREFMQKAERLANEEEKAGSISLETTLSYGYENWAAKFRIRGPRGTYVMKSIGKFIEDVRAGEHVSYGKKLAFTHAREMFDAPSRAIINFLERAVTERRHANDAFFRWHTYVEVGRELDLTEGETIELIDLLEHEPFTLECTDNSLPRTTRVHVVDGDPTVPLHIERRDEGGYVIRRDEEIVFVAEDTRMYLLQDDMLFRCSPNFARSADFLRNVYRSGDDRLFIATEDMPLFCATVLPVLEEAFFVEAPSELELMKPVEGIASFYFDKVDDVIEVTAKVSYGPRAFTLVEPPSARMDGADGKRPNDRKSASADDPATAVQAATQAASPSTSAASRDNTALALSPDAPAIAPLRDEALEQRACELVFSYFDMDATLPLDDEEAAGELLYGGLAQFRELGEVYTTPAFDRLIKDRKPRLQLGLSIAGNLINLDMSSDDLEPGELAALLRSYRRRKRFHRLRSGAYVSMEDLDLSELDRLVDDLGISAAELRREHVELPTYRAFFLDREYADAHRDESFTSYVERFSHLDQSAYEAPESLADRLRPYQLEGFRWLSALTDLGFGGILADEMGLGKSVQLISLLLARAEEAHEVGPSLIVCPASLVYNWLAEFDTFAPALTVCAVEGTKAERNRIRARQGVDVFVTSYDLARMDVEQLEEHEFFCCVLDEAQYIKNHATLTTRAVKRIKAQHRFALTGTPMENRLSEIWSIFDFLMPGFLGSYARFRERYELGILGGDEHLAHRLQSLVGPFILRRMKQSVLPDLPDKLDSVIYVPLAPEQRRLYAAAEQQLRQELNTQKKQSAARRKPPERERTKVEVLAELTRLRQIALDPALVYENYHGTAAKMSAILDLIEQTRDSGAKALVFSQFTSYLATIAEQLDRQGIPYYTITGTTPKKARLEMVNAFNADEVPVFLVSLKAGGTGLNLTGASVVIHADPWWNAAAANQATDRAHRIGQTSVVTVYKIIAKGTIEERILRLQEAKTELAESVIGEAGATTLASLTREELLDLLEG